MLGTGLDDSAGASAQKDEGAVRREDGRGRDLEGPIGEEALLGPVLNGPEAAGAHDDEAQGLGGSFFSIQNPHFGDKLEVRRRRKSPTQMIYHFVNEDDIYDDDSDRKHRVWPSPPVGQDDQGTWRGHAPELRARDQHSQALEDQAAPSSSPEKRYCAEES